MAKEVSKWVPKAVKLIEFSDSDYIDNSLTDFCSKKTEENLLTIFDGRNIRQYTAEFPIVAYLNDDLLCSEANLPEPRLNSFVLNITVSIGCSGRIISPSKTNVEIESTGYDALCYYENTSGRYQLIEQEDICKFLLRKPDLVISQEGVLVFYSETEILATADMDHYCWVRCDELVKNYNMIGEIKAYEEYCEIELWDEEYVSRLANGGKKEDEDFKEEEHIRKLRLNFEIHLASHQQIYPKLELIGETSESDNEGADIKDDASCRYKLW